MAELRILLLGPLRVFSESGRDITPTGRRSRAILGMLALADRMERSRTWLYSRLWSDRDQEHATASFRQELSRLRRALGADFIDGDMQSVRLLNARTDIADILRQGRVPATWACIPDLLEGVDIRDEEFEDWLRIERAHWRQRLEYVQANQVEAEPRPGATTLPVIVHPMHPVVGVPGTRKPAIGILPCQVHSASPEMQSIGSLLSELAAKLLLENGHFSVFDFRDLSGQLSGGAESPGNPASGPDLLLVSRVGEVGNLVEMGTTLQRVGDRRIVWTQNFACDVGEIRLLDGGRIAEFVNQAVEAAEAWLARHSEDAVDAASRLTLVAAHQIFSLSHGNLGLASRNLAEALDMAPSSGLLAWLALLEAVRFGERAAPDRRQQSALIRELTRKALEIDDGNSLALALLGHANAYVVRDFDLAADLIADAIRINPIRPAAWDAKAMLHLYTGQLDAGFEAAQRARSLGRFSPYAFWYEASCSIAASLKGDHAAAIRHGERVMRRRSDFLPVIRHLAASYALGGDAHNAGRMWGMLRAHEPDFTIQLLEEDEYPVGGRHSRELMAAGLTAAGTAG